MNIYYQGSVFQWLAILTTTYEVECEFSESGDKIGKCMVYRGMIYPTTKSKNPSKLGVIQISQHFAGFSENVQVFVSTEQFSFNRIYRDYDGILFGDAHDLGGKFFY